jgi:hypothetical protein
MTFRASASVFDTAGERFKVQFKKIARNGISVSITCPP